MASPDRLKDIVLTSTLHAPDGLWNKAIKEREPAAKLHELFGRVVVSCSELTLEQNPTLVKELERQGVGVVFEGRGKTLSGDHIENNHLRALDEALGVSRGWLMYADFDRLVTDLVRMDSLFLKLWGTNLCGN